MDIKKSDVIDDVSVLTTLPKQTLLKIERKKEECIAHKVLENRIDDIDITCVNIGFGELYLRVSDDDIEYKFIPSSSFESLLINTVKSGESPIVKEVDTSLLNKITQAYKDLF